MIGALRVENTDKDDDKEKKEVLCFLSTQTANHNNNIHSMHAEKLSLNIVFIFCSPDFSFNFV